MKIRRMIPFVGFLGIVTLLTTTMVRADALTGADVIELSSLPTNSPFGTFSFQQAYPEGQEPNGFVYDLGIRSGDHGATYNTAVYLTEADGSISDIAELVITSTLNTTTGIHDQDWKVYFFSDTESPLSALSGLAGPATTVPETGSLQDISGLFVNSGGVDRQTPLFNLSVSSELSESVVPEPASMLLFGTGLIGVMLRRKSPPWALRT